MGSSTSYVVDNPIVLSQVFIYASNKQAGEAFRAYGKEVWLVYAIDRFPRGYLLFSVGLIVYKQRGFNAFDVKFQLVCGK